MSNGDQITSLEKICARVIEWVKSMEQEPIRPGHSSFLTLRISRDEHGRIAWSSAQGANIKDPSQ